MTDIEGVGEIDYSELLELLDVRNVHLVGTSELGFSCIFLASHPFGDQHPSCHMNRHHGAWRCKSCHRRGGIIDFVGSAMHCSPMEALRWLRKHFGDVYVEPKGGIVADLQARLGRTVQAEVSRGLVDEAATIGTDGIFYIDWHDLDYPAVAYMVGERGLYPDVLAARGVGWDSWTKRVVLPYRDVDDNLVGFNARSLDPGHAKRYMVLGDDAVREPRYGVGYGFDMMRVEDHVFGLSDAIRATRGWRERELVVIEGEINQLTLAAGLPNVASVGNAWMSDTQVDLVRRYFDSCVLFFDSDEGGEGAVWGGYDEERDQPTPGIVHRLSPFVRVRVVDEHEGDANSMGVDAAVDLVSGARYWMRAAIE